MTRTINQILQLVRPALLGIQPYSSARDEFDSASTGTDDWVFLDANENPVRSAFNRYPDPHQRKLKSAISGIKNVPEPSIFLGNGSDEAIDLLIRLFCTPGIHNIIVPTPTYGMYAVSAAINDVQVRSVPLTDDFDLDVEGVLNKTDDQTRLLFLCSPNNPTGNLLSPDAINQTLSTFQGIVVVDEAYIDFSGSKSLTELLNNTANLVVLQTLSKAWGLAGLRLGMAMAHKEIIRLLNNIKPPYNISTHTQDAALASLRNKTVMDQAVAGILRERSRVEQELARLPVVERVYPSKANFLLVKVKGAASTYKKLTEQKIVVRDRSRVLLCDECLRITIGTSTENNQLINALSSL